MFEILGYFVEVSDAETYEFYGTYDISAEEASQFLAGYANSKIKELTENLELRRGVNKVVVLRASVDRPVMVRLTRQTYCGRMLKN